LSKELQKANIKGAEANRIMKEELERFDSIYGYYVDGQIYIHQDVIVDILGDTELGEEMMEPVMTCVLAHELAHALQDQVGVLAFEGGEGDWGPRKSLVEGHATWVQTQVCKKRGLNAAMLLIDPWAGYVESEPTDVNRYYGLGRAYMDYLHHQGGVGAQWEAFSTKPPSAGELDRSVETFTEGRLAELMGHEAAAVLDVSEVLRPSSAGEEAFGAGSLLYLLNQYGEPDPLTLTHVVDAASWSWTRVQFNWEQSLVVGVLVFDSPEWAEKTYNIAKEGTEEHLEVFERKIASGKYRKVMSPKYGPFKPLDRVEGVDDSFFIIWDPGQAGERYRRYWAYGGRVVAIVNTYGVGASKGKLNKSLQRMLSVPVGEP
jgi:hypothetical protein